MKLSYNRFFFYIFIIISIFFLDRLSKLYVLNYASANEQVNIFINDFLNIILIWNKGIGFGLFSFDNNKVYNFITFLILTINLLIIYLIIKSDKIRSLFYVIILGGSLGNLFDRFYYGSVPDFIDINFKGYHWFIFNVSDIFITVGVICLIIAELLMNKKNI